MSLFSHRQDRAASVSRLDTLPPKRGPLPPRLFLFLGKGGATTVRDVVLNNSETKLLQSIVPWANQTRAAPILNRC